MTGFRLFFIWSPFALWLLLLPLFVCSCGFGRRAKLIWAATLGLGCAKFLGFWLTSGDPFLPELPPPAIWLWDVLFSGALLLAMTEIAWLPAAGVCRLFKVGKWSRFFRATVAPALAFAFSVYGVWCGVRTPRVREVELAGTNVPAALDGYRILQLSDLHASSSLRQRHLAREVALANDQHADLIVITGDFVDGSVASRAADLEPIKDLRARDGVWLVTGNHEYYFDYYGWMRQFDEWGMKFLHDRWVEPHPGLALVGTDDPARTRIARYRFEPMAVIDQVPADKFTVLLQHRPSVAAECLGSGKVDLQLSGHTHGGVAPLLRTLVARANGGFVRGLYRLGRGWLYVSPGTGQWAGFPVRFFNDSEITVFTLRHRD